MEGISKLVAYFFTFLFFWGTAVAQQKKYIIYFTDKNNSPYSIQSPLDFLSQRALDRRQKHGKSILVNDLPVNPFYLDSMVAKGATVVYPLKWLNAAVVLADSLQVVSIETLPFVGNSSKLARTGTVHTHTFCETVQDKNGIPSVAGVSYGNSYTQVHMLEADAMHQQGYTGNGILMALLDGGFKNASTVPYLNHLFLNNKVVATYDFVDNETDVYDDHDHGLQALSTIAGKEPDALLGTAFNASFILLRTEDVGSETEIEEANWARGAEYADSCGVDIISSSLGYTTFDAPATGHVYADLNGHSTIAARAANLAFSKGILVFCSAGNEGGNSWKHISTPADGDSVLAVGAVDNQENRSYFSSLGPSASGKIKPDIAAMGVNVTLGLDNGTIGSNSGTSFSCPLVAGLAAGLWQAYPMLSNLQLAEALRKSASQASFPDNYLGYGIPGFLKAKEFINDSIFNRGIELIVYPNPIAEGPLKFLIGSEYFNKELTLKIYDIFGRLVAEDKVVPTELRTATSIQSDAFQKGLYIVRVYLADKTIKTNLVKL